jgi:cyclic pyranopterin phosphate synthase
MGAKRTPDLIPMCHPILMNGINLELRLNEENLAVEIQATVSCDGKTGVEMEALTAVSTAALTVYDMCKALDRAMRIENIHLLVKDGGKSGRYCAYLRYQQRTAGIYAGSGRAEKGYTEGTA